MQSRSELVYVTSCDVPLLQPAFVRQLISLAPGYDAVAPQEGEFCHPLSAIYRTSMINVIEELLARDQLRPLFLLQQIKTRFVPIEELKSSDPNLLSLRNLNHPSEYFAALESAGLTVTPEVRETLETAVSEVRD
jgi:molybdopterin-guanine dinucleotide biosynthesis protein A